jgi:hypothetical protein
MSPIPSVDCPIKVLIGSAEVLGYCSEDEARDRIRAGKATCQSEKRGVGRGIVVIEPEDAPLAGSAKQRAMAGYTGSPKYTYHEDIGVAKVIGHQIMLKRLTPSGAFARWR